MKIVEFQKVIAGYKKTLAEATKIIARLKLENAMAQTKYNNSNIRAKESIARLELQVAEQKRTIAEMTREYKALRATAARAIGSNSSATGAVANASRAARKPRAVKSAFSPVVGEKIDITTYAPAEISLDALAVSLEDAIEARYNSNDIVAGQEYDVAGSEVLFNDAFINEIVAEVINEYERVLENA